MIERKILKGSERFVIDDDSKHWLRLSLPQGPEGWEGPYFTPQDREALSNRLDTITIEEIAAGLERVYTMSKGKGFDHEHMLADLSGKDKLRGQGLAYSNMLVGIRRMVNDNVHTLWQAYEQHMGGGLVMTMELSYDPAEWFDETMFSTRISGIFFFLSYLGLLQAMNITVEGTNLDFKMPTKAFKIHPRGVDGTDTTEDGFTFSPIRTIADL